MPEQRPVPEKPKRKETSSDTKYGIACIIGGIIVFVASVNFGSTIILPTGLIGVGILVLTKGIYSRALSSMSRHRNGKVSPLAMSFRAGLLLFPTFKSSIDASGPF
ncbi:MAG: hypothetical protein KKD44_05690, partial [Proteobacteria bacterium]|nr:hypothetical protein [Pseudomonadota bacterium]